MSAPEQIQNGEIIGSRSSVKLSTNSKGETVVEVKAYIDDTPEQLAAATEIASAQYDALCARYRS